MFGVVLDSTDNTVTLLTETGRLVSCPQTPIHWHHPRWLDQTQIDIFKPYINRIRSQILLDPTETSPFVFLDVGVPREISSPVLTAIVNFKHETQNIYRTHAAVLDSAHAILAHDKEMQFGTLSRIADRLIGSSSSQGAGLSDAAIYAVRRALLRQPIGFVPLQTSMRRLQLWQIRPKSTLVLVSTAQSWIRSYRDALACDNDTKPMEAARLRATQGYINVHQFLQYAIELVNQSRQTRPCEGGALGLFKDASHESLGKMNVKRRNRAFTPSDQILIQFVEYWSIQRFFRKDLNLSSLPSYLIRATGLYADVEPDETTGQLFLKEIGCYAPYSQFGMFHPDLMTPGQGLSERLDQVYATSLSEKPTEDTMSDLRHDWGQLRVYCIDSASTVEVDDGVSLELIKGSREAWIRVHVAHPSAFLQPDGIVGSVARQLSQSSYYPDHTLKMLPPAIVKRCSLKNNSPALSISYKVNCETGEILETDIRSSIIRNVVHMTGETVARVTGQGSAKAQTLTIGPAQRKTATHICWTPSSEDIANLKTLSAIAQKLKSRRQMDLPKLMSLNRRGAEVEVYTNEYDGKSLVKDMSPFSNRQRPFLFEGDPCISLVAPSISPKTFFQNTFDMLAELMVTANALGCEWCAKRRIAIPYRVQMIRSPTWSYQSVYEKHVAPIYEKAEEEVEWGDVLLAQQVGRIAGPGWTSARPAKHMSVNMPVYGRMTSPLRRFTDLIAHWQIDAALREESRGHKFGLGKGTGAGASMLRFNEDDVNRMLERLEERDDAIQHATSRAQRYWITQWVQLAHKYGMYSLPKTLTVQVSTMGQRGRAGRQFQVTNLELGIFGFMGFDASVFAEQGYPKVNDVWEVEIGRISPEVGEIIFQPMRLVSRVEAETLKLAMEMRMALWGAPLTTPTPYPGWD